MRIKRVGESGFHEQRDMEPFDRPIERLEMTDYAHTEYQERSIDGFHIHWRIASGPHGPDEAGNIAGGMMHDLIAENREDAIAMARLAAPDHREFILNAQFQHHAHVPSGGSPESSKSPTGN